MSKKSVCLIITVLLALTGNALAQIGPAGWWAEHIGDGVDGSVSVSGTTYTIIGDGHDIWDNADGFQYMYKQLTGDGSMTARVVSIGPGSNTWAKAGVMIRQNDTAASQHAMTVITRNSDGSAGNGASFQQRVTNAGGGTNSDSGSVVAAPYWVRIVRTGNSFTGFISANGTTWTQLGSATTVTMTDPVLIGLCATSHAAGELVTMTFDNVSFTGNVTDRPAQMKAWSPDPADGKIGVTVPLFQWKPGETAIFHDVYFGTTPDLTAADLKASHQPFAMFYNIQPMDPGTTYYWRVDEIDASGTVSVGDVWKFSTVPVKDYQPAPADAAGGQLPGLILTWVPGQDAFSHEVYFGTDAAAVAAGAASVDKGNVTDPKFNTGALRASSTYYWRVDAVKLDKTVTEGDVWSFSTADAGPANKIQAEVWLNIGAGTTVADLTSNARYPSSPDTTEYLDSWLFPPGSTGGSDWANNYGDRLYGWLKPEQSGDYTFWIAGDDLSELWLSTDGSPTNVKMIAQVTGWTDAMDWDGTTGSTNAAALKSAPITLKAGEKYFMMTLHKEGGGGDSVGVAWQGPGIAARTLLSAKYVDMFYLAPLQAFAPSPANGAVDTAQSLTLSWTAGEKAQKHDVYLGDDSVAVAAADNSSPLFQGSQTGTTFDTGALEWGKTYYWRVDETNAGEADSPWKGAVWSLTTANFIPVDNFESYNDDMDAMTTIFDTWIDGVTDGLSNSTVGNFQAPFAEQTIVHGGVQSMPMDFDNTKTPFFSEAVQEFSPLQNWTANGVTDLSLWVQGYPAPQSVAVTEAAGKITLTGDGTDIWNNSDQFTFAYKTLNGDGSMTARVVSIGPGSNTWAKAGVMIRDSLNGGSTHAMMVMTSNSDGTAGNGASFQYRAVADGASSNSDSGAVVKPPYWVKIDRLGDSLTGSYSADGKTWRSLGVPQVIAMNAPVYIGLCVTSHAGGEQRSFEFDSITTTGSVTGSWQGAVIDSPRYNGAANLYVTVEDSAGKAATASDSALVNAAAWTEWKIPLSSLTGVNLAKVKKLYIGVGDKANPAADGAGRIYIDDIQVGK
jgi:hypothetical protein